ncbi:uncharacterized protein ACO6RY_12784 [Pungitius sinensis]
MLHRSQFTHDSLIPAPPPSLPHAEGTPTHFIACCPRRVTVPAVPAERTDAPPKLRPPQKRIFAPQPGSKTPDKLRERGVCRGESRTRTRSASAPSVHQRTKWPRCRAATRVTSGATGAKQ